METVLVNAEALRQVLAAIVGESHLVRELQATIGFPDNPVNLLVSEYNAATEVFNEEKG